MKLFFKDLKELFSALSNGEKIAHNTWQPYSYCKVDENDNMIDANGMIFFLYLQKATDWHLYQEPVKKVKLYLYAHKYGSKWEVTSSFYKNDSEFKKVFLDLPELKFIRLDNTMIEVEE